MAKRIGKLSLGGNNRSSGGFTASWQNLALVEDMLDRIAGDIGDMDSRRIVRSSANSLFRQKVKRIAERRVVPTLRMAAAHSRTRIAKHMSITPKADRFVSVQIGGANPKGLRGFKSYIGVSRSEGRRITGGRRGATSRSYRTTLAWGSEFGPHPDSKVNHYGVPRNEGGYWVRPGVNIAIPIVREEYKQAIEEVVRTMRKGR